MINDRNFPSSPASPRVALFVSMGVAARRKKATEDERARGAMIDNQIGTQPWRSIKTAGIYVDHSFAILAFIPDFVLPFCWQALLEFCIIVLVHSAHLADVKFALEP
jgi:hypothetical protein